jgi:Domain of Unknown Function (DUF1080)
MPRTACQTEQFVSTIKVHQTQKTVYLAQRVGANRRDMVAGVIHEAYDRENCRGIWEETLGRRHFRGKWVMMKTIVDRLVISTLFVSIGLLICTVARAGGSGDDGWLELIGDHELDRWRAPAGDWIAGGDAHPDSGKPNRLVAEPGHGALVNGTAGKTRNLLTKEDFKDLEAHFEFTIPKGANSGVKFEGLYEIQIYDSFRVAKPTASHCGGIYPRAEMLPKYHYLDQGTPPRVNAARPPGEWQTLDVIFRAPRFDATGKKVKNARFDKVVLNGQVIHENVELETPTGHAWRQKERPSGPILLQGDHGPVAFRKIRVRPLDDSRGNP